MFTGIVQSLGKVLKKEVRQGKYRLTVSSEISPLLKVDESVSHNGVCLTVVSRTKSHYSVDIIEETLKKTNLGHLEEGGIINLERSLRLSDVLSGHLVQGHVDTSARVKKINSKENCIEIWIDLKRKFAPLVIPQGSISVNGVSLTVSDIRKGSFKVSIIPYTFENTNIKYLKKGDWVNLEFDIMGKYLLRWQQLQD